MTVRRSDQPRRSQAKLGGWRTRITLLGPDGRGAFQSLAALGLLAITAVVAGITLGENANRLEELPGLLLMVPAAIALRGNVFGAMGSRLGTSIHAGTFRLSLRPGTVIGDNVVASLILTLAISTVLAVLAKGTAVAFGVANSISLGDFVLISLVGGFLASLAVLVVALLLAAGSVKYDWDPDNVTAPLVTAMGDLATVPALVLASGLVGKQAWSSLASGALAVVAMVALIWGWTRGRRELQTIVRESMPVLVVAVMLDLLAGVTVEKRLDAFLNSPRLLVLLPAFLAAAGALGGILSSRLSSKLHLGTIGASAVPGRNAWSDLVSTLVLAVPVFAVSALLTHGLGTMFGLGGPSLTSLISLALLGGLAATALAMIVAYYGTIAAVRFGLDPDTWGIPLVTAALDLGGAFAFILMVEALGLL